MLNGIDLLPVIREENGRSVIIWWVCGGQIHSNHLIFQFMYITKSGITVGSGNEGGTGKQASSFVEHACLWGETLI